MHNEANQSRLDRKISELETAIGALKQKLEKYQALRDDPDIAELFDDGHPVVAEARSGVVDKRPLMKRIDDYLTGRANAPTSTREIAEAMQVPQSRIRGLFYGRYAEAVEKIPTPHGPKWRLKAAKIEMNPQ